jgi:hypothetical protein
VVTPSVLHQDVLAFLVFHNTANILAASRRQLRIAIRANVPQVLWTIVAFIPVDMIQNHAKLLVYPDGWVCVKPTCLYVAPIGDAMIDTPHFICTTNIGAGFRVFALAKNIFKVASLHSVIPPLSSGLPHPETV